eukprot:GHVU01130819.1.p1 GENE.GHVU01130819.1~~GHVU01130819.1.p1  ORF type:complete len:174 (+),score=17.87 GHVU01130819.1:401-922(+)
MTATEEVQRGRKKRKLNHAEQWAPIHKVLWCVGAGLECLLCQSKGTEFCCRRRLKQKPWGVILDEAGNPTIDSHIRLNENHAYARARTDLYRSHVLRYHDIEHQKYCEARDAHQDVSQWLGVDPTPTGTLVTTEKSGIIINKNAAAAMASVSQNTTSRIHPFMGNRYEILFGY